MSMRCIALVACLVIAPSSFAAPAASPLRPPSDFASIDDVASRSVALFTEAGKVLQHPRCLNCHPVDRIPTQGEDLHSHVPPIEGGPANHGPAGLPCKSCHGDTNADTLGAGYASVPGDPHWSLAPQDFAWQKKSLAEICAQLKDVKRNGNRSLAKIHQHMAEDHLVGWAWHPGRGRPPAPGDWQTFAALIGAWVETGAHCPAG